MEGRDPSRHRAKRRLSPALRAGTASRRWLGDISRRLLTPAALARRRCQRARTLHDRLFDAAMAGIEAMEPHRRG